MAGIESAFIYGSWARRYQGETGAPPGDIDLLVVGSVQVDDVYDVMEMASARLSREVNPTVLTTEYRDLVVGDQEIATDLVHATNIVAAVRADLSI